MSILVNSRAYRTLADHFEVNGRTCIAAYANGILVYPVAPTAIKIVKPPDKTRYSKGEQIDFTGISVQIIVGHSVWTDSRYPDGLIPFEELIFPVKNIADGYMETDLELPEGWSSPIPVYTKVIFEYIFPSWWTNNHHRYEYNIIAGVNAVMLVRTNGTRNGEMSCSINFASETPGDVATVYHTNFDSDTTLTTRQANDPYTYDGKTVYMSGFASTGPYAEIVEARPRVDGEDGYGWPNEVLSWAAIYGTPTGALTTIPVRWESPYDGQIFEDTFEIDVTSSTDEPWGDDTGDGGGSSGGGDF